MSHQDEESPGPYRLLQRLGEGGMDSKQVLPRFEAERQALALMDHPASDCPP